MKGCFMWNFIWIFTVSKSTHFEVSGLQRFNRITEMSYLCYLMVILNVEIKMLLNVYLFERYLSINNL